MTISLSALRQKLFELADRVVASGEPLLIERKGVQLKLIRADRAEAQMPSRLARLQPQSLVLGAPLAPDESPSTWQQNDSTLSRSAEPTVEYRTEVLRGTKRDANRPRKPNGTPNAKIQS